MPLLTEQFNDRDENTALPHHKTIQVGEEGDGGLDTYYPVRINIRNRDRARDNRIDDIQIYRTYDAPGPSAHGSTKAGLTSYWHGTDGQWDGGPSYFYCTDIAQTYRRTFGAAEQTSGTVDDQLFLLRGGGYQYEIRCTNFFDVTIYLQETQLYRRGADGRTWFAVPRTESEINRLLELGPNSSQSFYQASEWNNTRR